MVAKRHVAEMSLKAEREGIEPTKDRYSPSTVLKTAAATRHAALSVRGERIMAGRAMSIREMAGFCWKIRVAIR